MSKGFSQPDPRTSKFIARLSKVLKSRNSDRLDAIIQWGYSNLGKEAIANILTSIHHDSPLSGINNDDANFFWDWKMDILQSSPMWPEVSAKARDCVAEILIDEGFTPGQDFSVGPDGMLLVKESAKAELFSYIPESEREKLEGMMVSNAQEVTLEAIANNIGIPGYFDRLFELAKKRLNPYIAADSGYFVLDYSVNFVSGTIAKFPELKSTNFDRYALGQMGSPEAISQIIDKSNEYPEPTEDEQGISLECLWEDIVAATGLSTKKEFDHTEDGKMFMSVDSLKIISRVWESPNINDGGFPLRELIAALEAHCK